MDTNTQVIEIMHSIKTVNYMTIEFPISVRMAENPKYSIYVSNKFVPYKRYSLIGHHLDKSFSTYCGIFGRRTDCNGIEFPLSSMETNLNCAVVTSVSS